jgi:hypothetical protein
LDSALTSHSDAQPIADPVAGLIDIPLPQPVSLWPATWPARIAIILLLAAAVAAIWRFARHRRANRYRREALAELKRIERAAGGMAPRQVATQLSLLVRATALAVFPRDQVAPLVGKAWLAFLDRGLGSTEFSSGAGGVLASAPYEPMSASEGQVAALVELTRRWIRGHHV